MKIVSIKIKNYRMFKNIHIRDIPPFCVIIGANGTGKSTLFDIFGFLRDALKNNIRQALQIRGGYKEVITRGQEKEDIEIELQFRMKISDTERLVTYILRIGQEENRPMIKREILRYKRGEHGAPFHFLDFQRGQGYAITNEEDFSKPDKELDREEQKLESNDILALKGLGQFQRFKAATAFRSLIENWHISDFHISEARGSKEISYAEHLSPTGDNMATVAQYIYQQYPQIFQQILERMKQRVPGISSVEAKETEDGRLILRFQDQAFKDPFIDRYVSDGTMKMFAYLILLFDPNPHPLLCVEEPENQLYPTLLKELAEEFAHYSYRGGQVFVSSHSPDFINAVPLASIFWLIKCQGITQIHRPTDSEILKNLVSEGDLPGYLWNQGWFEGVAP
ncbi:MAG: chromosome segregation protein SMC [Microcystis wesenbergii Mw_QC_S_20081001_S30D]|jgi:predicted ATPase|uniref:Chromosome segregation protein SMC n=1 Tax=Microcystis wesenbergii Mw_QC_S_20081001_S30D TaxID=2486245 RepID=A0A552J7M5_9CHRO|nr:AAA family ATPase [Microcystis aeruginosa W11-03]NCR93919.1 AAA family ATPase [Microcystis aeruginosa W11-06]TRU91770.1 MAG: chromosome segregation protein SMC [Microcystis wesenbergii Mw_QC_S_20081001_S30D]TRV02952.1 MAG: chromosome segregation protein SMC [Microcystis wesenbergii Mw_QC_S_20081001_S30]TRV04740.1 MAG: chromosome segregation protein SMC [Microcystis wesenbergii Mw_QC_B_20070930_S4D]TRV16928.1 MAG: chromosome segregation protein SMC [Microcystis wesenbergii Mw_QC_B_20070930_S